MDLKDAIGILQNWREYWSDDSKLDEWSDAVDTVLEYLGNRVKIREPLDHDLGLTFWTAVWLKWEYAVINKVMNGKTYEDAVKDYPTDHAFWMKVAMEYLNEISDAEE